MPNISRLFNPPSGIKSVQRGVTSASSSVATNVTISAVNLSKTFLNVNQNLGRSNYSGSDYSTSVTVSLTSATNLQLSVALTGGVVPVVAWEVVEFN